MPHRPCRHWVSLKYICDLLGRPLRVTIQLAFLKLRVKQPQLRQAVAIASRAKCRRNGPRLE